MLPFLSFYLFQHFHFCFPHPAQSQLPPFLIYALSSYFIAPKTPSQPTHNPSIAWPFPIRNISWLSQESLCWHSQPPSLYATLVKADCNLCQPMIVFHPVFDPLFAQQSLILDGSLDTIAMNRTQAWTNQQTASNSSAIVPTTIDIIKPIIVTFIWNCSRVCIRRLGM